MRQVLFRDLDQQELDREYSPGATVPSIDPYIAEWRLARERACLGLQNRCDVPFGAHSDELVDVFPATRPGSPVHVFLHGGYWRALSKNEACFYAEHLVSAGAAYVAVNYSLAPGASLDTIVDQCRRALVWTYRNAQSLNADPNRIYIAGHSAGAHLAGMMGVTAWDRGFGLPARLIKGICAVSGVFDLEPLRLSHVNAWLKLDEEAARRNSPIRHLPPEGCPLIVAWAAGDTREFKRQSREFGEAWKAKGFDSKAIEEEAENHFSVINLMGQGRSTLGRSVLAQMGLLP